MDKQRFIHDHELKVFMCRVSADLWWTAASEKRSGYQVGCLTTITLDPGFALTQGV